MQCNAPTTTTTTAKSLNYFQITNDFELTRFCLWLHGFVLLVLHFFFSLVFFLSIECHFNRLLCLSNDSMFSSAVVVVLNERFIYACCWVIISWQISGVIAELNLILSLLTHINAYPCTICNAQKDNLFTLKHDGKKSAAQQRSWFTDDECFGFMTLNRAQINKWHQMSRRATES